MKKNMKPVPMAFPTPVYIVGTYGEEGEPTAMNVAWGGICSSEPPCLMIAIRDERYTYENIRRQGVFTVNIPSATYVKEADYFGIVSGKKERKFDNVNLTPVRGKIVNAPVIEEFPVAMECRLFKEVKMGSHTIVMGEIVNIQADDSCLDEKGNIVMEKVDPIAYDPAGVKYNRMGEMCGKAFSIGVELMKK